MKKAARGLWDDFPAWFFYYNVVMIAFCSIAYTKSPRYDILITFIFPYGLFLLFYWAKIKTDSSIEPSRKRKSFLKLFGATLSAVLLVITFSRKIELAPDWKSHLDQFKLSYEITNIALTLAIAFHCFFKRGWKNFLLFFLAAALYGLALESSGVTLGYFFEDHYHFYLPYVSAPVVTFFGWSTVFYPSVFLLDQYRESIPRLKNAGFVLLAFCTAVIAVLFDAQIDPFATEMGLWEWSELYNRDNSFYWFGVPLINFASWFGAVFAFGLFYYFAILRLDHWNRLLRVALLTALVPVMMFFAGAVSFSILGIAEGSKGPSWTLLSEYYKAGMPLWRKPITD